MLRRLRWRKTQEGEGPGESEEDGEDERHGDQTTENQQSSSCPGAAALDLIAGNTGTGNKRRERRRRHEGGSGLSDERMDLDLAAGNPGGPGTEAKKGNTNERITPC